MSHKMTKVEWAKTQYHDTDVSIWASQGDIMGLVKEHWGVKKIGFVEFQGGGGGVILEYHGRQYRFDAVPLEVIDGSEKQRAAAERQAWRWLFYHVKDLIGSMLFIPVEDLLLPHLLVAPGEGGGPELTLAEALRRGTKFQLPEGRKGE